MGKGKLTEGQMLQFFLNSVPPCDSELVQRIANLYIEEAAHEDVNHDVAFAQMVLETGFLRFTGSVRPEMNNFCGLGAVNSSAAGHKFIDARTGVRAHIQHLKAYGSKSPLILPLVDPRYDYVNPKGRAGTVTGLAGTWAKDPLYAKKIASLLNRMHSTKPSINLQQTLDKQIQRATTNSK
ncbi:MAG: glucosaminidase domain-containing protein [Bacteroidales bacterium]